MNTELPKYPVCQLNNYRCCAFPSRNNFLNSLLPSELYQGWSEYFYWERVGQEVRVEVRWTPEGP